MGDWVKVRRSRCRKGRRLLRAPLFQASFHFQGPFLFLFSEVCVENASKGLIWMVLSEGVAGMSVYFWSVYSCANSIFAALTSISPARLS